MPPQIVCPGEALFSAETHTPGYGTFVRDNQVCAALVGTVSVLPSTDQGKATVQIVRKGAKPIVPASGDVVDGKVSNVNPRLAVVEILCVGTQPLIAKYTGIIRARDVRATEIDKVDLPSCFRPGDLVRAEILSLGDSHSYYLSTAKNELGVVQAKSLAGVPMVPISWEEMQCPKSKVVEKRKVAKV